MQIVSAMIDYKPVSHNLIYQQDFFWLIFVIAGILWLINRTLYHKRFIKNVSYPNVYIFEYESHSGHIFSFYNIINYIIGILVYILLISALFMFYQGLAGKNFILDKKLFTHLTLYIFIYAIVKTILSFLYLFLTKKSSFFSIISFIRRSFEVYKNFYWYLFAFLIWFFPVRNTFIFIVFLSISVLWYLSVQIKSINNFIKHTDIKSYQLFLYLCLSEILPIIILIWWISFQIL